MRVHWGTHAPWRQTPSITAFLREGITTKERTMNTTPKKRKLTATLILNAARRNDGTGFCRSCGATAHGVEPDARQYDCENCGKAQVYGAEELVMMYCW